MPLFEVDKGETVNKQYGIEIAAATIRSLLPVR